VEEGEGQFAPYISPSLHVTSSLVADMRPNRRDSTYYDTRIWTMARQGMDLH